MNSLFFLLLIVLASPDDTGVAFDEILELAVQSPSKAIAICEKDTKNVEVETADIETAQKLEFLARYYAREEKNSLADSRVLKAKAIAERLDDRNLLRKIYQIEAVIASHKGEFRRGVEASTKSIELTKRDSPYLAIPLSERGICRMQLGEFARALQDLQRALDIAVAASNHKLVLHTKVNMANAYDSLNLHERAIEIYKSSLEIANDPERFGNRSKVRRIVSSIHANIGDSILNKMKSTKDFNAGDLAIGAKHFRKAIETASNSERSVIAIAETGLGDIAYLNSNFEEAGKRYETASKIYGELFDVFGLAQMKSRISRANAGMDAAVLQEQVESQKLGIASARATGRHEFELDLINSLIIDIRDTEFQVLHVKLLQRKNELSELRLKKISSEAIRKADESIEVIQQNYELEALERENQFAEQSLAQQRRLNFLLSLLCVGAVFGCGLFLILWRSKVRVSRKLDEANHRQLEEHQNRAEIEKVLAQQEKLDSLSTMSAGVMHDFNNYLLAIIGEAEIGAEKSDSSQMLVSLRNIMESAQLASGLTKDLSNYIGAGKLHFLNLDLNQELLNARPILQSISNNRIRFRTDNSVPIPVAIDPAAFRNVLINLVKNAAEASTGDHEIIISTRLRSGSSESLISIIDSGVGMTEESIDKAFDPFFTSKGLGRGLGLPSAKGIVESHGGELEIIPRSTIGTKVQIVLPVTDKPLTEATDADPTVDLASANNLAESKGRKLETASENQTILFVDDDEMIRRAISSILETKYQTAVASSAEEALLALSIPENEIGCIITDYSLPGSSGVELAEEVARKFVGIPVILISGFPERSVSESSCIAEFLPKPFTRETLFSAIDKAIDERRVLELSG